MSSKGSKNVCGEDDKGNIYVSMGIIFEIGKSSMVLWSKILGYVARGQQEDKETN